MIQVNEYMLGLPGNYLFSEVANRVAVFRKEHPEVHLISMGIGDVTRPLPQAVIEAMAMAVDEMGSAHTFRGYGPEQGYSFLREAILEHDFLSRHIRLTREDIFISDGCKSDMGHFGKVLSQEAKVALTDPVYPVYADVNAMEGRAGSWSESAARWNRLIYLPCSAENNFIPSLPDSPVDLIYLCFPNNPTGTTLTREELKKWVDYALENKALILFDAAYEAFITDADVPHSIYEIDGALNCAVEFRSFSKTAGFTGIRCGYTVVPSSVLVYSAKGEPVSLNKCWNRMQSSTFNGVSYVTQRGAAAVYSSEGRQQCLENITYYRENARLIRQTLSDLGYRVAGGVNAPYIWFSTPDGLSSWQFFQQMLEEIGVIGTPGSGFGPSGEGYMRLTAFGSREQTLEAMERLIKWKKMLHK
jgi:LL-diaminopimelate aminotransferase